jgi:hypothetical protein
MPATKSRHGVSTASKIQASNSGTGLTRTGLRVARCWSSGGYNSLSGWGESWFEPQEGQVEGRTLLRWVGLFRVSVLPSLLALLQHPDAAT